MESESELRWCPAFCKAMLPADQFYPTAKSAYCRMCTRKINRMRERKRMKLDRVRMQAGIVDPRLYSLDYCEMILRLPERRSE